MVQLPTAMVVATPTDTNSSGSTDTDGDGVPDGLEGKLRTNADNKDTDGDGDTDLQELMNSTNPKDPASNLASMKNGGSTTNNNGGNPITINMPGQNGGTTQSRILMVQSPSPSQTALLKLLNQVIMTPKTNPAGGTFKVNPDGTVTTRGMGTILHNDPNKNNGATTQPGNKDGCCPSW